MSPPRLLASIAVLASLCAAQDRGPRAPAREDLDLQSIGPIGFVSDSTLLVGDPVAARVYAFAVEGLEGDGLEAPILVEKVGTKVAALLGTEAGSVRIIDMAVRPGTGQVFLSLTRRTAAAEEPLVVRIGAEGTPDLIELGELEFTSAELRNPPEPGETRRDRNRHLESITDLGFIEGKVVVAGLSNEEFSSKLRLLDFPFGNADTATSIKIYHGAHGKFETNSPVRTFVPYAIAGEGHILAAYTCTPLVKFKAADLSLGEPVTGTTIAELGNRNRPLDMIAYEKADGRYLLIANSSRGVMKLSTDGITEVESITTKIDGGGTAGVPYETLDELEGVVQLDKLDDENALILVESKSGELRLRSIPLP